MNKFQYTPFPIVRNVAYTELQNQDFITYLTQQAVSWRMRIWFQTSF